MEAITALDKFKRRLVRDIARRLFQEKQSEDEMFEQLGNEYGCDCKLLWDHMKSLTLKKLKRLLAADDRADYITKIARMTATDWLTFDLVLVHEKVDVIGEDMIVAGKSEPTVHSLLFDLVGKYNIEGLAEQKSPEPKFLIEAWFQLTQEYNTGGRECSPMLLQRRWYQLKECTRMKIYDFWKNYRGNPRLYEKAIAMKPTPLQIKIADKYPIIVTDTFEQWEELIKTKQVLLASAFEIKRVKEFTNNDGEPDLIMIEPSVETIEVDACSDGDEDNKYEATNSDTESVNIKGEVEVKIEPIDSIDIEESELIEQLENNDISLENENTNLEESVKEFEASAEETDILLPKITSVMGSVTLPECNIEENTSVKNVQVISEKPVETSCENDDDLQFVISPITKDSIPIGDDKISTSIDNDAATDVEKDDNEIHSIDNNIPEIPLDLQFVDDGIELIDDEYVESKPLEKEDEQDCEKTVENDSACTIDPKLIMFPITYTTKIDDMGVFKNASFLTVKGDDIIKRALVESRPIFSKAVRNEQLDEEECDDKSRSIKRLKFSNWRLQKPKNRSYNPIQLCKNPDFNTRLKKLTAGFFSSERNRLLFSACKPLTIDLHKGFEDSLVDNTIYLETIDSPIIKEEKDVEVCENNASVLPSAMAVQSLLDNSKLKVQELLQTKAEKPEEEIIEQAKPEEEPKPKENITINTVVIERNKVVKLPDIDQIRQQNLLVAEVSPMPPQNNTRHGIIPPVQLVNTPQTASPQTVNIQSDAISSNKPSAVKDLHEESRSVNVVHNDQNKRFVTKKKFHPIPKPKPTKTLPAWSQPSSYGPVADDSLITKDTLHKMLCLLSGVEVPNAKTKYALQKAQKIHEKELANKEKNKEIRKICVSTTNVSAAVANDKIDLTNPKKVKRRKSIRTVSSKSGYCCWAQYRLKSVNSNKKLRHLCPKPLCRCCCRSLLVNKMLYDQGSTDGILRVNEIDVQDDPTENQHTTNEDISSNTETLQQFVDQNNLEKTEVNLSSTQIGDSPMQPHSAPNLAVALPSETSANEVTAITIEDDESPKQSRLGIPLLKTKVISGGSWSTRNTNLQSNALNKQPNNNTAPIIVIDEDEPPSESVTKLVSTQEILPKGVNIVLLPDKRVSVAIDPNVQVDQEELAKLPEILLSVQKYFAESVNNNPIQNDSNGVVDSNPNPNEFTLQAESDIIHTVDTNDIIDSETVQDSNTTDIALNVTVPNSDNVENDTSNYLSADDSQQSNYFPVILKSNEQLFESTHSYISGNVIESKTETHSPKDSQDNTDIESDVTRRNTNKTTILSDLMAMSGISQEDSNIFIEEPIAAPSPTPSTSNRILNYSVFNTADFETGKIITRKGKRFKKVIVSIKKKHNQNVPLLSDSVIDLTEDGDNREMVENDYNQENDNQISDTPENTIRRNKEDFVKSIVKRIKNSNNKGKIIPIRMYKPQPIILKKVPKSLLPFKLVRLNDLSVRNNEEEVGLTSSYEIVNTCTKKIYRKKKLVPLISEDNKERSDVVSSSENDSSDDEPLAKKIRRTRGSSVQSAKNDNEPADKADNIVQVEKYDVPIEFVNERNENNDNGTVAKSILDEACEAKQCEV